MTLLYTLLIFTTLMILVMLGLYGIENLRYKLITAKTTSPSHLIKVVQKLQKLADRHWMGCPRGDVFVVLRGQTVFVRKSSRLEKKHHFFVEVRDSQERLFIDPITKIEDNLLRDLFWSKHRLVDMLYQESCLDKLEKLVDSVEKK